MSQVKDETRRGGDGASNRLLGVLIFVPAFLLMSSALFELAYSHRKLEALTTRVCEVMKVARPDAKSCEAEAGAAKRDPEKVRAEILEMARKITEDRPES